MTSKNLQYITDNLGNKISVILPISDFYAMMEEFEVLEDVKLYEEAKAEDIGERILLRDYLKERQTQNA